jgi:hypothetical protein
MKKILTFAAILIGCSTQPQTKTPAPLPPVPPAPVRRTTTKAAASIAELQIGHAVIPSWTFTNSGNYRIEASTNLTSWWAIAVVYSVTNLQISSDLAGKRPVIFYRLVAQ